MCTKNTDQVHTVAKVRTTKPLVCSTFWINEVTSSAGMEVCLVFLCSIAVRSCSSNRSRITILDPFLFSSYNHTGKIATVSYIFPAGAIRHNFDFPKNVTRVHLLRVCTTYGIWGMLTATLQTRSNYQITTEYKLTPHTEGCPYNAAKTRSQHGMPPHFLIWGIPWSTYPAIHKS